MRLSVIVCTSPQRELNLVCCLDRLKQQHFQDFEVIVVDDGSDAAEQICSQGRAHLSLTYQWRPNDCCLARSRNIGFQQASTPGLVFIDSDILLNPFALDYYSRLLEHESGGCCVYYGYYGNREFYFSPSLWFHKRTVQWEDGRFPFDPETGLFRFRTEIFQTPAQFAWGGNFALPRTLYEQLGGFNEQFVGWGREDNEFAARTLQAERMDDPGGVPDRLSRRPRTEHRSTSKQGRRRF